jgi:hypothetical protein
MPAVTAVPPGELRAWKVKSGDLERHGGKNSLDSDYHQKEMLFNP